MCLNIGLWSHSLLSCLTWRTKAFFSVCDSSFSLPPHIYIQSICPIFFKGLEFLRLWEDYFWCCIFSLWLSCVTMPARASRSAAPDPHLSHGLFGNSCSRTVMHVPFDPTEQINTWNSMDENIWRQEADEYGFFHSKEPFLSLNRHAFLLLMNLGQWCCCAKCVIHPITIQTSGSQKQSSMLFSIMAIYCILHQCPYDPLRGVMSSCTSWFPCKHLLSCFPPKCPIQFTL